MTWLLHWLWQGTIVAAAAGVALRWLPRLDGATRHAILWLALGTVLALPFVWPDVVVPAGASRDAAGSFEMALVVPTLPSWVVPSVTAAWLGWVAFGLIRIGLGWHRLRELCGVAEPLPASLVQGLASWPALAAGARPDVRVSREIRGACATGVRGPVILLSADLVDALPQDALGRIVLHEHAHLERGDHWGRLVQSVVEAVAGLHPAVAYLLRRIDLEREVACDELVVARTREARDYARSLVEAAAVEARGRAVRLPALVPGATRSTHGLRVRVQRLLHGPPASSARARVPALAAGALAALGSLGAAGAVGPAVVFMDVWVEGPRSALAPWVAWSLPGLPALDAHAPEPPALATVKTARAVVGQPASPSLRLPADGVADAEAPAAADTATAEVEGRSFSQAVSMADVASDSGAMAPMASAPSAAWSQAGPAGRAVGQAADRGGTAIGSAAARGGKAIGAGARRAGTSVAGVFAKAF